MSDELIEQEPGTDVAAALTLGWQAFMARIKDFAIVAIALGLIFGVVTGLLTLVLVGGASTVKNDPVTGQATVNGGALGATVGLMLVTILAFFVVGIIGSAIETRLALAAVDDEETGLRDVAREAMSRIGPYFGWGAASFGIVMVGFVLCFIPGIAAAFFLMLVPFIVIEGRIRDNPLRDSVRAVKERAGELIIVFVVIFGLNLVVSFITFFVGVIPFIGPIIQGILSFILGAYALCTYAVVYRSSAVGALGGPEPHVATPPGAPPLSTDPPPPPPDPSSTPPPTDDD